MFTTLKIASGYLLVTFHHPTVIGVAVPEELDLEAVYWTADSVEELLGSR